MTEEELQSSAHPTDEIINPRICKFISIVGIEREDKQMKEKARSFNDEAWNKMSTQAAEQIDASMEDFFINVIKEKSKGVN